MTGGFVLRIFEWQAVAAARVLAGRASLPDKVAMEKWEQDRLEERGDGPAFWALMPEVDRYFEDLRTLAGEPASGTTGRVLPRYEEAWGQTFFSLIGDRIKWWQQQAAEATNRSNQ